MIRPYTHSDKQAVVNLLQLNIPRYFAETEAPDFIVYLDEHLEDYFVIEEAGTIVGAGGINYFPAERLARLSWDIVHPDFQGKGIGTNLTQHRINHINKNPTIDLIIVRTSQVVYKFYEKLGFVLEHTEKDYWAKGFDLYQMRLPLRG
ncbi:GNAT family N-acetyltransferase [Pontibacter sp. BT310]|uniref:GNAT family N-acetyltransferase n=1 Tax=Pontibacter populi TaxID=890055 RepID=A0ABS6XEB3_9BACT|nr:MULTISPECIES: N-acetyltransferase [Pontibacter]MBJ6119367.1 GNAT family N-acetyltransferase [Pontibacter sp. BT310]MBR0571795.1 GNAT family N-acetyltransferase [Microvirga sp. STS03]MBW3366221.1 GNAT family N-acetyltransferase [Pontibacter populi]